MSERSFKVRVGDLVENMIGKSIVRTKREAPVLKGAPEELVWYRIPLRQGLSGDGSEYHIYLKKGNTNNLCVFFSGGGVAWDAYTAAHPVTGGAVASGTPNYYWNNLRPFTQIMNINIGITENDPKTNPFAGWNFIVITYSTGDFHVGDNDFEYTASDGTRQTLHFHGKKNVHESLKTAKRYFPSPEKLLIAGDSAGGFAVPAHAGAIASLYYPKCGDITLLTDSSFLPFRHWKRAARDVWKSDEKLWAEINTPDITFDWYASLHKEFGGRFKYLYACSTHDYLLSTYYNYIVNAVYETNKEIQEVYYEEFRKMVQRYLQLEPKFGFYINDWRNVFYTKGGTIHTAVREQYFTEKRPHTLTMAEWLFGAVNGDVVSCGMELLEEG